MNIKSYILSLGVLAMLLPSCYELEKPFEKVQDGISKEITAILDETRTSIDDDWNTSWVNGDQMIVYVTRTSGSNKKYGYSPFKYSEGGTFTGTVYKDFCSPWNWFAVYPSSLGSGTSSSASPEVTHPASQKMTGSSNAHIAGDNDPLYGYAVGEKDNPAIRMHHISSMVEFHITNGNDLPIQVTKIEFTAPKNIVGTYKANMDLWASTVKEPTWSESKNLGKTVTLSVTDAPQTESGESSDFYATIHPISESGSYKIKVTANVGGFSLTAEKTISTKLTFNAGKIKTLDFTFAAEIPDPFDIENPKLAAYLDSVEAHLYFTNNTFGSYGTYYKSSLMQTYAFYDGNNVDNRLDQPSPVQLSWTGSATKVEVFKSPSKTEDEKVAEVTVSGNNYASIYNLTPGVMYYYVVSNNTTPVATGTFTPKGRRRMMRVSTTYDDSHACNCRDFGGLPTVDGKTVKYGKIYRGSNIDGLKSDTDAQNVFLKTMGIKWDIDLRASNEKYNAPTFEGVSKGSQSYSPTFDDSNLRSKTKVSATMTEIITAVNKGEPVYIHCRIGSDRTGYICMLVEALIGVTQNYCDIDYETTSFASKVTGPRYRVDNTAGGGKYASGIQYIEDFNGTTLHDKVYTFVTSADGLNIDKTAVDTFIENMKN